MEFNIFKETTFENGSIKREYKDGATKMTYTNGDVRQSFSDGQYTSTFLLRSNLFVLVAMFDIGSGANLVHRWTHHPISVLRISFHCFQVPATLVQIL